MKDHLDQPSLPFPFSDVSNGEWCPRPPTDRQRAAVELFHAEAERNARRLGLTRREFVRSAAGTAAAFWALNTVAGLPGEGKAAVLPVTREQARDPQAAQVMFQRKYFVMDVQLHHVDLSAYPPAIRDAIAAAVCGLRFLQPNLDCNERIDLLSQANFIQEVFFQSETDVGVISGVPNGIPLPVETMRETRDLTNQVLGADRALAQAMIDPLNAPGSETALDTFEHQVVDNGAVALKCYTGNGGWRLDDEQIAYPMLAEATRLGIRTINVHKGFPGLLGNSAQYVRTDDLLKVTRDWPRLNFVVYHAAYFPDGTGIQGFLDDIAAMGRRLPRNLYAEIGSTFAVTFLQGPDVAAHLIGSLLKALGPRKILWGTDSIWWGSPQWQIDAFKTVEIPDWMQDQFGYPPLREWMKRRILGRTAARLYRVPARRARRSTRSAGVELELPRAERTQYVYGPQTPEQYDMLLAHEGARERETAADRAQTA